MKTTTLVRLSLAAVLLCLTGLAVGTTQKVLFGTTTICTTAPSFFYINGIWGNDQKDEDAAAAAIQKELDIAGIKHSSNVNPLFNPTEGKALDIFRKLLLQKAQETAAIADLVAFAESSQLASTGETTSLSASDLAMVQSGLTQGASSLIQSLISDPTAAALASSFTNQLAQMAASGYKVVLIAHSEGNMFAEQIYNNFQSGNFTAIGDQAAIQKALQIVNVATPAAKPDTGNYLTSKSDVVITDLAALLSWTTAQLPPAPANVAPGFQLSDWTGHQFLKIYLNDSLPTNAAAPIAPTMAGEVMRLVNVASTAASAPDQLASQASAPILFSGEPSNVNANFIVSKPDGTASTQYVQDSGEAETQVLSLTCDQLEAGTYQISAQPLTEAQDPSRFGMGLGLYTQQFGLHPVGIELVGSVQASAGLQNSSSIPMAELDVQPDQSSGGFDLTLYGYQFQ